MGKGDHKVIPKAILKRFTDETDNKLSCLEVNGYNVKRVRPDAIFTEIDYFEENIDNYIKDNVESIIGTLHKVISDNVTTESYTVKRSLIDKMKNIFFIQYWRNLNVAEILLESSEITKFVVKEPKKFLHNYALAHVIEALNGNLEDGKIKENFQKLDEYYMKLTPGFIEIVNSDREFLISESQFYYINLHGDDIYCFPISPKIALTWQELKIRKEINYGKTDDDRAIEKINRLLIQSSVDKGERFVFGTHQEINRMKLVVESD